MTQRYRIGLIGTGARGESFARQLHQGTSRAELFGVCDIDAERLEKFCEYCKLDDVRRSTDVAAFLAHDDLDAVVITVPEFAHAEVAIAAMQAGKHVYIEKPLAHTLADIRRIVAAQQESHAIAYVGFNLRASPARQKLKEIVHSGILGQLVHVNGLEQLSQAHGASFMRRFHRKSGQSGGLLNHKCSHDLDILLWLVGHEHHVARVTSFGGTNIFTPDKQPAKYCHECPAEIHRACPYKSKPGFFFPIDATEMFHHNQAVYGGDLCVYDPEKDIVDNQTVMLEWEHGVRGSFSLNLFQHSGGRETRLWGEKGYAELDGLHGEEVVRVTTSDTGDTAVYRFAPRGGGHGGSDPLMISLFVDAMERGDAGDSGLQAGLAASVAAIKADEARLTGRVVTIEPGEWTVDLRKPEAAIPS